jgi:hypothetical protein
MSPTPSLSVAAALLVLAGPAAAQNPGEITPAGRFRFHAAATAGPFAMLTASGGAGIRHWLDSPTEWGQGWAGYGRRLGYSMANRAAKNGIEFAAGAALREDPRYFRSHENGIWKRARYALCRTFLATKDDGAATFAGARFLGAYGGGFLSNLWYPDRLRNPGSAVLRGTLTLAGEAGGNVFREFWPDIRKRLRRNHAAHP